MSVPSAPAVPSGRVTRPPGQPGRREHVSGRRPAAPAPPATSSSLCTSALLLLLGIAPAVYAIYLALSNSGGFGANFVDAFNDYRFVPAFEHILEFMAIWLVSQTVFVVGLVLMLHNLAPARRRGLPFPLLHPGGSGGRRERGRVAVHARPDREPVRVRPALVRLRAVRQHDRAGQPSGDLRDHGVLDRRRRMDRRDVRRAQQHSPRADRGCRRSTARTRSKPRCGSSSR